MATFYGGEQLTRVLTVQDELTSSTDITVYTVPAGRYAEVFAMFINYTGGADEILIDHAAPIGTSVIPDPSSPPKNNEGYVVFEGDSIRFRSNVNAGYKFLIKEYAQP